MKISKIKFRKFSGITCKSIRLVKHITKTLYKYIKSITSPQKIDISIKLREITNVSLSHQNMQYLRDIELFKGDPIPYELKHSDQESQIVIKHVYEKSITPGFTTQKLLDLIENKTNRFMVQQSLNYFILDPDGILSSYHPTRIENNKEITYINHDMFTVFGIRLETLGFNVLKNLEILICGERYSDTVIGKVISSIYDYGITNSENIKIEHLSTGTYIKFSGIDIFESSKFEEKLDAIKDILYNAIDEIDLGEMYESELYDTKRTIQDIQKIITNTSLESYKQKYLENRCMILFKRCKFKKRLFCKVKYDLYKLPENAIRALVNCLKDKRNQEVEILMDNIKYYKPLIDTLN